MRHGPRTAGFTLIEALVVTAIMALIAGLGFPAVDRMVERGRFTGAAAAVEGQVREARSRAMRTGSAVTVLLPSPSALGLRDAARIEPPRPAIRYFADGSSNGGRIVLASGDRSATIDVARDTGAIAVVRQ